MAAQGVHAQGINPLLSADLYSKVVVPIALYGSELWSNMTATELNTISRFQHYAVKRIQGLPTSTRSDMAESMLGLNRLPSQIESRKLMFLHKILSLASNSVTRNIFIRKLILFINNNSLVSTGFIPDICNILCKYNLLSIVNNILVPAPHIPSKNEWKRTVKIAITERESHDWDHRMSLDLDFTLFRILHPCIAPSIVYQVCNRSFFRNIMCVVARLWVRPVSLDNIMCDMCGVIYQEQLVHYLCECEKTQTLRLHFINSLPSILLPDEMDTLLSHDSVALTLRLLGAPLDPILDRTTELQFLHSSYTHIVKCLNVIIE